jgi:hypothetical protein
MRWLHAMRRLSTPPFEALIPLARNANACNCRQAIGVLRRFERPFATRAIAATFDIPGQ